MALGQTNISITSVRNLIGSTSYNLFLLGTSALVNMWSKYKPVRGTYPASSNGKYGYDIPLRSGSSYTPTNWAYLKPQGGSPGGVPDEPVRLGDFRGYEHNPDLTYPPVYANSAEQNEYAALHPAAPNGYSASGSVIARFVTATNALRPSMIELGFGAYYFGLICKVGISSYFIKTLTTAISTYADGAQKTIGYSASLVNNTLWDSTYSDLPFGTGAYEMQFIICSNSHASWTSSITGTIYKLPSGSQGSISFKNTFSFIVKPWLAVVGSIALAHNANTRALAKEVQVFLSNPSLPYTVTMPNADFTFEVWTDSIANGGTKTSTVAQWVHGTWIRVWVEIERLAGYNGLFGVDAANCATFAVGLVRAAAPAVVLPESWDSNLTLSGTISGHTTSGIHITFTANFEYPKVPIGYIINVNGVDQYSSGSSGIDADTGAQMTGVALTYSGVTYTYGDTIIVKMYRGAAPSLGT